MLNLDFSVSKDSHHTLSCLAFVRCFPSILVLMRSKFFGEWWKCAWDAAFLYNYDGIKRVCWQHLTPQMSNFICSMEIFIYIFFIFFFFLLFLRWVSCLAWCVWRKVLHKMNFIICVKPKYYYQQSTSTFGTWTFW